jgi:hypothetical protein
MILHPCNSYPKSALADEQIETGFVSGWEAVFQAQKAPASSWLLVAQPDHAALAGDLAQRIRSSYFPRLDDEMLQAIALHDEGWNEFDTTAMVRDGRPLSFLDLGPADFLKAWRGSIECAERAGPVAGLMVSGHFFRLGDVHLQSHGNSREVSEFVRQERGRQQRLMALQTHSAEEISILVDVLQFCDLLSLYFCCGSCDSVEFPQKFRGHSIRLQRKRELCRMEPALFGEGTSLGVVARKYPEEVGSFSIPVLVA